jgi:hypothetical protein
MLTTERQTAKAGRRGSAGRSVYGVLHIHSTPPALCPYIEWAVAGILGLPVTMVWTNQPVAPGQVLAELNWRARPGAAGEIASALAGWNRLRFEVTEEPSQGCDGVRYSYTPNLGIFTAIIGANGDLLIPEARLHAAMELGGRGGSAVEEELSRLLGEAWDAELDPFRATAGDTPVTFLDVAG